MQYMFIALLHFCQQCDRDALVVHLGRPGSHHACVDTARDFARPAFRIVRGSCAGVLQVLAWPGLEIGRNFGCCPRPPAMGGLDGQTDRRKAIGMTAYPL